MPIVLEGFDELLDRLGGIESLVSRKKILATAMRKAEEPMRRRASDSAPDDPESWRRLKFGSGNIIREHMRKSVLDQGAYSVLGRVGDSTKGFPGLFQQFGTATNRGTDFFSQAVDSEIDEFQRALGEQLMAGILGGLIEEELDRE